MAKILFFAVLAMLALRRLSQSDLLDGTAFKALQLVVCTKGLIDKKGVDSSLCPTTSWGYM